MSETPGDAGWDRASERGRWLDPERRNAAIGLAALVVVAGAIVGAAILFTDPPQPPSANEMSVLGDADPATEEPATPEDEAASDDEAPEGLVQPDDGEDEEPFEEAAEDAVDEEQIDFDGVCTVTVSEGGAGQEGSEAADEPTEAPRPWHFDECTSAPVAMEGSDDQRWIAVLASLPRHEYDEAGARDRAVELGFDDQVLYSSHYPSLNPDLWVVYDGPFADEDEARAAAAEHGGGAYPRVLADEAGDRY